MPDVSNEEWRPGCPDCAHLREELATARAEMRAAVVAYEVKLREEIEHYQTLLAGLLAVVEAARACDPMDVYGPLEDQP